MYNLSNCTKPELPFDMRKDYVTKFIELHVLKTQKDKEKIEKSDSFDKEARLFIIEKNLTAYDEILKIPIEDEEDIEFVIWLFNDGYLRDSEEILKKNQEIKKARIHKIMNSPDYNPHFVFCFIASAILNILFWGFIIGAGNILKGVINLFLISYWTLLIPILVPPFAITHYYVECYNEKRGITEATDEQIKDIAKVTIASCASYYLLNKITEKVK